jgi:hypothetical protein
MAPKGVDGRWPVSGGAVRGSGRNKRGRGLLSHRTWIPWRKTERRGRQQRRRSAQAAELQWRRRQPRLGARETVKEAGKLGVIEGGAARP